MAFSIKQIKAILSGFDLPTDNLDKAAEEICSKHKADIDAIKEERDTYKADAEKLEGVQKELDTLKAKGDDGYKDKYEAEKKAFADYKAEIETEKAYTAKENAYRELLKAAGVKEKFIDTIVRADKTVIEGLKLGEDGKIDGADTLTANAKQNWSDFVATTTTQTAGVENPPANNGGSAKTKEQIMAIKDPATRQAEMAKNPGLFGIKTTN